MNLAQKQNQADCIADKSMSMSSVHTERVQTENTEKGEDKTPKNRKAAKSGEENANQLPEDQEFAELWWSIPYRKLNTLTTQL